MTDDQMECLVDVIIQSRDALDVGLDEAFEDHPLGLVFESWISRVLINRCGRFRYLSLQFIFDGGTNVPAVEVLSSDIFGYAFASVHEGVSLLVVATVKDLTVEFAAVSIKLGSCLAWLSAGISGSSASTATLTCLGSSR